MSEIEKLTEQVRKLAELVAELAAKQANPIVVTHYHHSVPQPMQQLGPVWTTPPLWPQPSTVPNYTIGSGIGVSNSEAL